MKAKKMIANALVLSMFASVATTLSASAADVVTIGVEKVTAQTGSTFTLDVSLSDVPTTGIGICDFAVTYDDSIVSVTNVTAGAIAKTGSDEQESQLSSEAPTFKASFNDAGKINVSWVTGLSDSSYWIKQDGIFLTITGTVNTNAQIGDVAEFKVAAIDRETTGDNESDVMNTDILVGYLDEEWNSVQYDVKTVDGSVTIVGDVPTTTTDTPVTTTNIIGSILYGDVNLDNDVSLADLVTFQKFLRQAITFNDQQSANANVDLTNMEINDQDATALMRFLIKLSDEIPVQ